MKLWTVALALCSFSLPVLAADFDSAGVQDEIDNCITRKNPLQEDWDFDLWGNRCDTDLDQNRATSISDFSAFKTCFTQFGAGRCYNSACDFNSDGTIDDADVIRLGRDLDSGAKPGPSGLRGEAP